MGTFHSKFKALRNALGYRNDGDSTTGSCTHYAEMAINAWLLGPTEYAVFLKRRQLIDSQYETLAGDIQAIWQKLKKAPPTAKETKEGAASRSITPDEQEKLDVAAFMEGDLYQEPRQYHRVFGKPLGQTHAALISPFVESDALRVHGGRALLASHGGIYNQGELNRYLANLIQHTQHAHEDIALSLGSGDHRIALCYRATTTSWTLIDSNHERPEKYSNLSSDQLTNAIYESFFAAPTDLIGFNTAVWCRNDTRKSLQPIIDAWIRSDAFQTLPITREQALRQTSTGETLAWLAARRRDLATLRALARLTAHTKDLRYLNISNSEGITPAFIAADQGHADCLKILAEAKADLSTPWNSCTPAFMAAQEGHADCLKILAEAKANLSTPRSDGVTPAFMAATKGHADCLRILAEAKTDLSTALNNGATPAFITAQKGHADCLKILAEAKADLSTPWNSATPAFIAAQMGHADCLKILAEAKADLSTALKDNGATPAFIAAQHGHADCLRILAANQVNVNIPRADGVTPAMVAIKDGHIEALQILLEQGADLTASFQGTRITALATDPKMIAFLADWAKNQAKQQPTLIGRFLRFFQKRAAPQAQAITTHSHTAIDKRVPS